MVVVVTHNKGVSSVCFREFTVLMEAINAWQIITEKSTILKT